MPEEKEEAQAKKPAAPRKRAPKKPAASKPKPAAAKKPPAPKPKAVAPPPKMALVKNIGYESIPVGSKYLLQGETRKEVWRNIVAADAANPGFLVVRLDGETEYKPLDG